MGTTLGPTLSLPPPCPTPSPVPQLPTPLPAPLPPLPAPFPLSSPRCQPHSLPHTFSPRFLPPTCAGPPRGARSARSHGETRPKGRWEPFGLRCAPRPRLPSVLRVPWPWVLAVGLMWGGGEGGGLRWRPQPVSVFPGRSWPRRGPRRGGREGKWGAVDAQQRGVLLERHPEKGPSLGKMGCRAREAGLGAAGAMGKAPLLLTVGFLSLPQGPQGPQGPNGFPGTKGPPVSGDVCACSYPCLGRCGGQS